MKTDSKQNKLKEVVTSAKQVADPPVNRKPKIKVLLVDDHPILRAGLGRLINQEADMMICGEAEDGPTAFDLVGTLNPDIAVIDIFLGSETGIPIAELMIDANIAFVFCSGATSDIDLPAALKGSVMIPKPYSMADLIGAIFTKAIEAGNRR